MTYRIGVIGSGRRRNGIGEYVAKYLSSFGGNVVAIVCSSLDSSIRSANHLFMKYGITAHPYSNVEQLFKNETLDIVAVCTPFQVHREQLELALENSVHVFCEKPLFWETENLTNQVEDMITRFHMKALVLYQNAQWIYSLPIFEQLYGPIEKELIHSFCIELYPPRSDPTHMSIEAIPHANSLLLALGGKPLANDILFEWLNKANDRSEFSLTFTVYGINCQSIQVCYRLFSQGEQPRPFAYAINGKWIYREIDFPNYLIYLGNSSVRLPIPDPLQTSVKRFLDLVAQAKNDNVIESDLSICDNMRLLDDLVRHVEDKIHD